MKTQVSIIIPVYNALPYLKETMDCIQNQTYENIEIICVDDGSEDGSDLEIEHLCKNNRRIRLIRQKHMNAGEARNRGLKEASGDYLMFLDADDLFEPEYVEKMVGMITDTDADISICMSQGYDNISEDIVELDGGLNPDMLPDKDVFSGSDIPDKIFQLTAGWAWDKIFRKGFITENNIKFQGLKSANDELFTDTALAFAKRISAVKEVLVTHRCNVNTSIEAQRSSSWMCGFDMLKAEKAMLLKNGLFDLYEESYVNRAAKYIVWNLCSITNKEHFLEFYNWFKAQGNTILDFSAYQCDAFIEEFYYDVLSLASKEDAFGFLCGRIADLNNEIKIRDTMIADYDSYVKNLESAIAVLEDHARNLDSVIADKHWRLRSGADLGDKRIVIYGFGDIGRDLYEDIICHKNMEIVMVVDKNHEKYSEASGVDVRPVSDIKIANYDLIIIAVYDEKVADEIKEMLVDMDIPEESIKWYRSL